MSKICKNCGKEVEEGLDFCIYCDEKLPKHLICSECREEYPEFDQEYCSKCGGKLAPIGYFRSAKTKLIGLSGEEEVCYNFWSALLEEAERSDSNFSNFRYNFLFDNFKFFAIEGVNPAIARIHNRLYFDKDKIAIKIHIPNNKGLYDHLHKRKEFFNKKFGEELKWDGRVQASFIVKEINGLSVNEISDWEEMIKEFIRFNNKFCEVFSKDIKKFLGPIEKDENYSYWSKVQDELNKTDLTCLHSYINWNFIDISFSYLNFYYGYLTFVKYVKKAPQVRCYIRGQSFDYLYENKENIESELGFELNWGNNMFYISNDIPNKPEFENEIVKWQIYIGLRLDEVIPNWINDFFRINEL